MIRRGKIEILFSGTKYHVCLLFEKGEKNKWEKQTIVSDGNAIFTSIVFTKEFPPPNNCHGLIYEPAEDGSPPLTDFSPFPWNVSRMSRHALDLEGFLKKTAKESITTDVVRDGAYRMNVTHKWGKGIVELERESGFNISKVAVFPNGVPDPVQLKEATWEKSGDIWYVKSALDQREFPKQDLPSKRWRLVLEDFQANCEVPDRSFNLEALEMPPNTRILDHRPNAKEPVYHTN